MPVPSYDDLTPSISDVHPRDTFDQVTRLVSATEPVVTCGRADVRTCGRADVRTCGRALYGCIRTAATQSGALLALAKDFSPRLERHGDTCVVLDVSGLGRLLGDAHGIAAELTRAAADRGIKARIAIAPTQTAARLLSLAPSPRTPMHPTAPPRTPMHPTAPPRTPMHPIAPPRTPCTPTVITGDVAGALIPLPLTTLSELVGESKVGELAAFDVLKRWGIRAVGELAVLPPDEIAARFGQSGVALQRLARGIDPRPLIPDATVRRFVERIELEWPIEELEPLSFVFARMLDPLAIALERADRAGAALRLDLRLVDRSVHSRMLQLPAPIRDPRVLRTLLLLDLESHPPSAGIDIVTIEVDPAPSRIVQYSLLERATPSPETIATLTARLTALVGESRCGSPSLLDSHRPDAFEMHRFRSTPPHPVAPRRTPLHPAAPLRRFRPPVAVRVAVEHGRPVHIANLRRGIPCGGIKQSAGPWRTSGAWWSAAGEHWDRDEWDVALTAGTACRLYRDRVTGRWFLDGVFD